MGQLQQQDIQLRVQRAQQELRMNQQQINQIRANISNITDDNEKRQRQSKLDQLVKESTLLNSQLQNLQRQQSMYNQ